MSETQPSTESEILFQQYLVTNGYRDFDFEPEIPGKSRRIDYRLQWNNRPLYFEVKQRQGMSSSLESSGDGIDPYKGIREEIGEATSKFKEYKDDCCSLVIANMGDWDTHLHPEYIFGAMLGDLGLEYPVFLSESDYQADAARSVILRRHGKMVRSYRKGLYQNTSIAAVIALETVFLKNIEFERAHKMALQREEHNIGRPLSHDCQDVLALRLVEKWRSLRPIYPSVHRAIVCENPGAKYPLPRNALCGHFDERWAIVDGFLSQVYAGVRVHEISKDFESEQV